MTGRPGRWLTTPLSLEAGRTLVQTRGDRSDPLSVVLDTCANPTASDTHVVRSDFPVPGYPGGEPSAVEKLARVGRVAERISDAEGFVKRSGGAHRARVVVRGPRDRVTPLGDSKGAAPRVEQRVSVVRVDPTHVAACARAAADGYSIPEGWWYRPVKGPLGVRAWEVRHGFWFISGRHVKVAAGWYSPAVWARRSEWTVERSRGGKGRAVRWTGDRDRTGARVNVGLLDCWPVEPCGLSYCPQHGAGKRLASVAPRVHGVGHLARDWGFGLYMVTLTAPHTYTTAQAQRRKRGASLVLKALAPTGRFVLETKSKEVGSRGPDCCDLAECKVCGGAGYMPPQHLHAHAVVALPPGRQPWQEWHEVVRRSYVEHGWWSIKVTPVRDASRAAGYLASYISKVDDDPWQWVRLRTMLGLRWGESWGGVRGAVTAVRGRVGGRRLVVHHIEDGVLVPSWCVSASAVDQRIRDGYKEFRRAAVAADFLPPSGV